MRPIHNTLSGYQNMSSNSSLETRTHVRKKQTNSKWRREKGLRTAAHWQLLLTGTWDQHVRLTAKKEPRVIGVWQNKHFTVILKARQRQRIRWGWEKRRRRRRRIVEATAGQSDNRRQCERSSRHDFIYIYTLNSGGLRGVAWCSRALHTASVVRLIKSRSHSIRDSIYTHHHYGRHYRLRISARAHKKANTGRHGPVDAGGDKKNTDVQRWKCYVGEHLSLHKYTHGHTHCIYL